MKTSELYGAALDWAVAKCEGVSVLVESCDNGLSYFTMCAVENVEGLQDCYDYRPSTDWAQGGPIMVREDIIYRKYHKPDSPAHGTFYAMVHRDSGAIVLWRKDRASLGPTPLIAAMRCYVACKLDNQIELPKGLT